MEKEIKWTSRSVKDLRKIYNFNIELQGEEKAFNLITKLINRVDILADETFTEMGNIDETFVHLKRDYKKIIEGNIKITYRESQDKSIVYINRVFDTRQNPSKNK